MSSEQIINRVANTPALQAELEEAGLATPYPGEPPVDIDLSSVEVPPADPETDGLDPQPDPVDWSEAEEPKIEFNPQDAIAFFADSYLKFREQTIAALKHLGLDTTKFFGE